MHFLNEINVVLQFILVYIFLRLMSESTGQSTPGYQVVAGF